MILSPATAHIPLRAASPSPSAGFLQPAGHDASALPPVSKMLAICVSVEVCGLSVISLLVSRLATVGTMWYCTSAFLMPPLSGRP